MLEGAWMLRAPEGFEGAPAFVREVVVPADLVSATLEIAVQGLVEARVDGRPVTEDVLVPGWSAYQHRMRVVSYDVTGHLIQAARHRIELSVGNGWFCGRLGWMGQRARYGERPGAAAVLTLRFADASGLRIATDERWDAMRTATVADDLYDGQTIDLSRELDERHPVQTEPLDRSVLVPFQGPPIRRNERRAPVESWRDADGGSVFDFGQNLVGWVRVRARGPRGHRLVIQHAEVLDPDGRLALRPLRSARAEDVIVLSGGADDVEPVFTFHGFRYARIQGWDEVEGDVEAVIVGSALGRTGRFSCSDPALDRFHRNVVWSLRGNTVGIPTDCPQRDERLGWTGDIAVFAPTACFLFDMDGFLREWLTDLRAEQSAADGRVPYVVPDALPGWSVRSGEQPESVAIWSDAAVWVPWALWEAYGDATVLADSWDSMTAHVERVLGRLSPRGVWEDDFQFGDWLDPTAPPDDPFQAIADPGAIATLALFRSLRRVAAAAVVLGRTRDARRWTARAERLRRDFHRAYADEGGRLHSDAPAVYALAIVFAVVEGDQAQAAGERLAHLVRAADHRVIAGFAGAPYLCDALTMTGHLDDAHALLMNRSTPGWLAPVLLGATTVWERWDSLLPDGTVNPGEMTSFNHYALGAVADWIHRVVGGLSSLAPGWRRVRIDPRPPAGMSWARTSIETAAGTIRVSWHREQGSDDLQVEYSAPDGVDVELAPAVAARARRVAG
ncbi:alpha-L-rhamnosidase [Microbacterium sp. Clip185]|uniref:alpha-L-rhamnosidase n=1 Tax=Microbacterium sp. Clip185 TaxID=3025663 RepID=UPI002366BC57|nr:alpha-L-rhamnosidase [Microbacterium sp. Clip185]WDG17797.1 family 78 glycoside hydrolase catalytic domain [Microbacterium sp. Clip185]